MSQLKGNLCDFCQCPIGHVEDSEYFKKESDFVLERAKSNRVFWITMSEGYGQDWIDEQFEDAIPNCV